RVGPEDPEAGPPGEEAGDDVVHRHVVADGPGDAGRLAGGRRVLGVGALPAGPGADLERGARHARVPARVEEAGGVAIGPRAPGYGRRAVGLAVAEEGVEEPLAEGDLAAVAEARVDEDLGAAGEGPVPRLLPGVPAVLPAEERGEPVELHARQGPHRLAHHG